MEYLIVFLPLIGSLICYLGKDLGNLFSEISSSLLIVVSAVLSIIIFYNGFVHNIYGNYQILNWINSGELNVNWSINIDPLSSVMIVVVTLISAFKSYLYIFQPPRSIPYIVLLYKGLK